MSKPDPLPWLLEHDPQNPGVRYFALRDLLGLDEDDAQVRAARRAIMETGPVPAILQAQDPAGFWAKPGAGYSPKYQSTVWQIHFLAELGADPADPRVRRGCAYLLDHSLAANGGFAASTTLAPSAVIHCLNGNMLHALLRLGCADDPRVGRAVDWEAHAISGDEPQVQYYESGTSGPGFACGINLGRPCAWGAVKALRALSAIPEDRRSEAVRRALEVGAAFLLSRDPAVADYPYTGRVSLTWFRLGFPLSYWSDVLETAEVLARLGYGRDPRLAHVLDLIEGKQDPSGRWRMENTPNRKTWIDVEARGKPSKWVTLRALRLLHRAGRYAPPPT
jgi:hypothetical protein